MSGEGGIFKKLVSGIFGGKSARSASTLSTSRHLVGQFDELRDGQMKEVEISLSEDTTEQDGNSRKIFKVLLSRIEGQYYATSHLCTHYRARLVTGVLAGDGRVTCPWHAACFDVRTGDIEEAPAIPRLKTFPIEIVEGPEGRQQVYVVADRKQLVEAEPNACPAVIDKLDDKRHIVIIGGGAAGAAAAEGARVAGFQGRITIVSKEPHLPIDRIKLSKVLDAQVETLLLYKPEYLRDGLQVEVLTGTEVTAIDPQQCKLQIKKTQEQGELSYDRLLIATGGEPRRLPIPGGDLQNIFTIRSIDQNHQIMEFIRQSPTLPKVVIVGASFIGMEAAAMLIKALQQQGSDPSVTVVAPEKVPLVASLGASVGSVYQAMHERNGIQFRLGVGVSHFSKQNSTNPGRVGAVHLVDGTVLEAELVILGVGVRPATDFIGMALPREVDGGLRTNQFLALPDHPNIFTAGDIASFPVPPCFPHLQGQSARIEHWDVAVQQGRVAGRNMALSLKEAAALMPYESVPFFFTMQFGRSVRYAGLVPRDGCDEIWFDDKDNEGKLGDATAPSFAAYYLKGDCVLAVATMGRDPLAVHCGELMRQGRMPSASKVKQGVSPLSTPLA